MADMQVSGSSAIQGVNNYAQKNNVEMKRQREDEEQNAKKVDNKAEKKKANYADSEKGQNIDLTA